MHNIVLQEVLSVIKSVISANQRLIYHSLCWINDAETGVKGLRSSSKDCDEQIK